MRRLAVLLALVLPLPAAAGLAAWPAQRPFPAGAILLDARADEACITRTVRGARCLPAREFRDAAGRLPDWREVLWLFSTARLTGSETVLVLGERPLDRDQLAALLHIAGQREVRVVEAPVSRLLAGGMAAGPGAPRDFARQVAYTARMRDALLVLPHEFDSRRQRAVDASQQAAATAMRGAAAPVLVSASPARSLAALTRWWLAGRHDVRVVPEPFPVADQGAAAAGPATLLRRRSS